jgi:hypothetical protein
MSFWIFSHVDNIHSSKLKDYSCTNYLLLWGLAQAGALARASYNILKLKDYSCTNYLLLWELAQAGALARASYNILSQYMGSRLCKPTVCARPGGHHRQMEAQSSVSHLMGYVYLIFFIVVVCIYGYKAEAFLFCFSFFGVSLYSSFSYVVSMFSSDRGAGGHPRF